MAEGIEVRFLGKLTYYAVFIYLLFILGLFVVCRQRHKSRTGRKKSEIREEGDSGDKKTTDMGLKHSRGKGVHETDHNIRRRKDNPGKKTKATDSGERRPRSNLKDGNQNLSVNGRLGGETVVSRGDADRVVCNEKPTQTSEVLLQVKNTTVFAEQNDIALRRDIFEPESVARCLTSANCEDKKRKTLSEPGKLEDDNNLDRLEMGLTKTSTCENGELSRWTNSEVDIAKESYDSGPDAETTLSETCNVDEHAVDDLGMHSKRNLSISVYETNDKTNNLESFANKTASRILTHVFEDTTLFRTRKPICTNDSTSSRLERVTDRSLIYEMVEKYANVLAKEIIYGDLTEDLTSKKEKADFKVVPAAQRNSGKGIISVDFCQAIASDLCRDAPRTARNLENIAVNISNCILDDVRVAFKDQKILEDSLENANIISEESNVNNTYDSPCNQGSNIDMLEEGLKIFSDGISKEVMLSVFEDVNQRCNVIDRPDTSLNNNQRKENTAYQNMIENVDIDNSRKEETIAANVNINHLGKSQSQKRIDSQSNFDADDEEEEEDDSTFSDDEEKPPIVIHNRQHLKLKLHSDRPLSSYAEQLVDFLADDDNDLDMFESDEEFNAVLDKLEEKYREDQGISTKIQKRRRLSECRRKSIGSTSSEKLGRLSLSVDTLDDMSDRERLTSTLSESSFLSYTDTDDAMKGVFSDDQPLSPSTARADMQRTVVIDAGCGFLKTGLAGELAPQTILPSVIGVPRRFSQDVSRMTRGYFVGEEAIIHAGMLQLDHPLKPEVTNWSDVYSLLEYVFEECLHVNIRDHPILLTEIGLMPRKHREKLTEIMFERFGAQAFYLANQGPLSLYSLGLTTGLCVNSGYSRTQSIPVYEGHSLPYCTNQLDIGGSHIANYLGRLLLSERGLAFSTSSEKFLLSNMMEKFCYVAEDLKTERQHLKKNYDDVRKIYELPDGQIIDIDSERFESPEIFYSPDLLGLEQAPLHEIMIDSIASAEQELKATLMKNTVITGGTTKLPGFTERLETELSAVGDHTCHFSLKKANNPVTATWTGASVISSLSTFSQQCIVTDQYAEIGSQVVHLKCF